MRLLAISCALILLVGCASNAPLRDVRHVGDNWVVAAHHKNEIFVQTKPLEPIYQQYRFVGDGIIKQQTLKLHRWSIRYVNAVEKPVCVKVNFLQMDYSINVQPGWFILDKYATIYPGEMIQDPMITDVTAYSFKDAKWVVDTINVVDYDVETQQCQIKTK